ncbi:hypothetical protein [Proteus hauseri]|uniref:hypothetical protein n=1 Tax=Proteus hauseri TaxID=183417 RepID=UPI001009848A|nr:hypothetical protein [Proteus hauseri]QAV22374.1 hypothetical protein PH4a_03040 [Proteus hauseri]
MSVNKERRVAKLTRITLFIIFGVVTLFMVIKFLFISEDESVTKFSAFFTVISSLGIIVSVVIYLNQKSSENKKQKEIDVKLLHFINIKTSDFIEKINHVLFLIQNENEYKHIKIEDDSLCYVEIPEDDNPRFYKKNLRLKNKNEFLDRHAVWASLDLFKFAMEVDLLSEVFFNKTTYYIKYSHEYAGNYIPGISDYFQSDVERELLTDFLNETKEKIRYNITKFND